VGDQARSERREKMKKAICLVGIALIFVSMVLAGCASMAPREKTIVTKNNLSTLKGSWSGRTSFKAIPGSSVLTDFVINNNTVPLQGSITLYNLPQGVANMVPNEELSVGNNLTVNFKNGLISDRGTIVGTSGQNFFELTYYAGEPPRLDGWFFYYGANGTTTFTKK
jgi:hypothetical protein